MVPCVLPILAQFVQRPDGKPSPFRDCLIPSTITFAYQVIRARAPRPAVKSKRSNGCCAELVFGRRVRLRLNLSGQPASPAALALPLLPLIAPCTTCMGRERHAGRGG